MNNQPTVLQAALKISLPVKTRLYAHQKVAFRMGRTLDQLALLMEQGTGKTLSAIATAGYRYNQGQIKRLLVISPLSVSYVWESEFLKHADFDYSLVNLASVKTKKKDKKLEELGSGLQVIVINYESSWRYVDQLIKWNPDMIIADESQKIKNGRAKQSRGLFKLGDMVKYKMILTGTPITQGPLDTWSQYRFLNPDIFGRKFVSFRNRYAIMEGLRGRPEIRLVVGYKNLEELAEKAHSIAYRVTKDEALDLPPTVDQTIRVQLSSEAQKLYKQMEKDFMVTFSDEKVATAPIILTQLLRLQQITGGFLHTEDKTVKKFDSSKLEAVKELLSDLPWDKKVVIFARFSPEIEALKEVCRKLAFGTLILDGSTRNRGKTVEMFQNDHKSRIIIIQIQAGGLGITLTSANMAIFYSTTFSFADYEQAKARLHRIGQHHPVTYVHLIATDTVDENILDILKSKGDMATQIMDRMRGGTKVPFTKTSRNDMVDSEVRNMAVRKICPNCKSEFSSVAEFVFCPHCLVPWGKKEAKRNRTKGVQNVRPSIDKEGNLIGLDEKVKGGWYWSETTGNILRREPDESIYILQKEVGTLEEAQKIIANLNKSKEGDLTVSKKSRKLAAVAKQDKKAAQVIEETVEEVEEEVVEEEEPTGEDEPQPKKTNKTKKAKKAEKPAATAAPIDENAVGVKELAGMVNLDPKALRKVLREMFPDHEPKSQWTWKKDSKTLNALVKKLNK